MTDAQFQQLMDSLNQIISALQTIQDDWSRALSLWDRTLGDAAGSWFQVPSGGTFGVLYQVTFGELLLSLLLLALLVFLASRALHQVLGRRGVW
ncbi:MAG: hypothetical protein QJR14_06480 [Bacillota bacterium]|nr:hypothetical protein [Bacillota bacterium]